MTTFTFVPNRTMPGSSSYSWSDPTNWSLNAVPNGPTADVDIPTITQSGTGAIIDLTVDVPAGQTYAVRSLSISNNHLNIETGASLAIDGMLTLLSGGVVNLNGTTLSIGALSNGGVIGAYGGVITSPNALSNSGSILGGTLNLPGFTNTGSLSGVSLITPAGGFTNFSGGTLTGGTYTGVAFNIGGVIVTDAANLTSDSTSYDPASHTDLALQDTLRTIAPSGTLTVSTSNGNSYTTSDLTVAGGLVSEDAGNDISFTARQLTIAGGGRVAANGTISGAVTDDGLITVAPSVQANVGNSPGAASSLVIDGPVGGSGTLEITPAVIYPGYRFYQGSIQNSTLELNGAASANVVFDDQFGTLKLDQPGTFTGRITTQGSGDTIRLAGIALGAVTGYSYAGDANGGTLTLDEAGSSISLAFVGNFQKQDFVLTAGPQPFSSSPPSLDITVAQQPGNAFEVDGSHGVQSLVGTGYPNFIDTSGAGSVILDLAQGTVHSGLRIDAKLTNIQGVQLGANYSVVLGLTSGMDLIYGGTGTVNFTGNGATDVIQGGTGSNIVYGGSGNEIFYSNGGSDVMRGGSADNFMSGGSAASSSDVFYGTTGNDFVYGHGGAVDLVGGTGNEFLSAGSGNNELDGTQVADAQGHVGTSELLGSTGTDLFYGGIGTNLIYGGSGTDTFVGSSGTDYVFGGSGRSFTYAGSGTDVVTTGSGNDYVQAGKGALYFNDTAANLTAGRYDQIDGFSGSKSTDLYLPTAVQGATSFVSQNGGTALITAVGGGSAELFVSNASVASVQAHTHFTL